MNESERYTERYINDDGDLAWRIPLEVKELLPCPFCGKVPIMGPSCRRTVNIYCTCAAAPHIEADSKIAATKKWNQRKKA